jgi:hypothetical protein
MTGGSLVYREVICFVENSQLFSLFSIRNNVHICIAFYKFFDMLLVKVVKARRSGNICIESESFRMHIQKFFHHTGNAFLCFV